MKITILRYLIIIEIDGFIRLILSLLLFFLFNTIYVIYCFLKYLLYKNNVK